MIFRTLTDDSGNVTVSVEEDHTVLFTLAVADKQEAASIVRKGVIEGVDTIRPAGPVAEPEVRAKKKKA